MYNMIKCFRGAFICTKTNLAKQYEKVRNMMYPRNDVAIECDQDSCKTNPVWCKFVRFIAFFIAVLLIFFILNSVSVDNTEQQEGEKTESPSGCNIEIGENMKEEIRSWIQKEIQNNAKLCAKNNRISPEQMRSIIKEEIKRQQKIQLKPDFASASAGGIIVAASPTWTEGYSYIYFLFIPIRSTAPSPSIILEPTRQAGDCWPMEGQRGSLLIQLAARANIVGFTLEHIDPAMSLSGSTPEAPNNFSVYTTCNAFPLIFKVLCTVNRHEPIPNCWPINRTGLESYQCPEKRHLFGTYCYDNKIDEENQYFRVQNINRKSFLYILLEIGSNHGNDKYTCLYRFQVHGYIDRGYHCQT